MIIEKVRERVSEFYQKAPASLRRLIGGHLGLIDLKAQEEKTKKTKRCLMDGES